MQRWKGWDSLFILHLQDHPGPRKQQRNLPTMVIQEKKNNIINQPQAMWVSISWDFYSGKSQVKIQCKVNIHSIP